MIDFFKFKATLHSCDKTELVTIHYVLLIATVITIFEKGYCIYVHKRYWITVFVFVFNGTV